LESNIFIRHSLPGIDRHILVFIGKEQKSLKIYAAEKIMVETFGQLMISITIFT